MIITKLKRITLPIVTGFVSLQISILFCLGVIVGYLGAKYFTVRSIKIPLGKRQLHLHHWLIAMLGLATVLITKIYEDIPSFVLGIGGGLLFQGIYSYGDWHKILKKKQ
ncbi:MAG: hypothetical protein ABH841_01315 [Candidatus Nealsonbacteria bacterium]